MLDLSSNFSSDFFSSLCGIEWWEKTWVRKNLVTLYLILGSIARFCTVFLVHLLLAAMLCGMQRGGRLKKILENSALADTDRSRTIDPINLLRYIQCNEIFNLIFSQKTPQTWVHYGHAKSVSNFLFLRRYLKNRCVFVVNDYAVTIMISQKLPVNVDCLSPTLK